MPNGELTSHFAANPGKIVEIDHMLGANMSFRREVICKLGGFRDDIPAGFSGACEETDMCLRVKLLGYKIVFNPFACVDHLAGPQVGGKRFDHRYTFLMRRNLFIMFIRNYGFGSMFFGFCLRTVKHSIGDFARKQVEALKFARANIWGTLSGVYLGTSRLITQHKNPVRYGEDAEAIRTALSKPALTVQDE